MDSQFSPKSIWKNPIRKIYTISKKKSAKKGKLTTKKSNVLQHMDNPYYNPLPPFTDACALKRGAA